MSNDPHSVALHFAHANGFPAGSYKQVFQNFPPHFEVFALEKFAHNHRFPVNPNLQNLVVELIDYLEHQVNKPVYGIGHSMGALVTYMAACERPDLFKGVIMMDPPIASGISRWVFKAIKRTSLIDKFSPSGKAKTRCQRWSKETDLVKYFKVRGLFRHFEHTCIEDYVAAAIKIQDDEYQLIFDRQIEASIYRNVPSNINRYYGRLKVPALLVTGQNSDVCVPRLIASFVRKTKVPRIIVKNGGHMFPLEQPQHVANILEQQITKWEESSTG